MEYGRIAPIDNVRFATDVFSPQQTNKFVCFRLNENARIAK